MAYSQTPSRDDVKKHFRLSRRVDFDKAVSTEPKGITYKLFTERNPEKEIILTEENVDSQNIAKDVKTVMVIHGWTSSDLTSWYPLLKEAYLKLGPHNIIYVNWNTYANLPYDVSSACVKPVGELIARFLGKSGVPPKNIHLVGHSLGGQLAGFIGKAYQKAYGTKIGRITALDPAGPKWFNPEMKYEERLNDSDANFVDVIHTDIQMSGYTNPCGHVDYYPNGGSEQPGCTYGEDKEKSSHHRAPMFFAESINNKVKAIEINFKEDDDYNIVISAPENPKQVIFGEHVNLQDRGVYYLETNATSPFLK